MLRSMTLAGLGGLLPFVGLGQQAPPPATLTITSSIPVELDLLFYATGPSSRLSVADSLARRLYARQKIRSVTKLQLRKEGKIDSVEYTEFDRQGNQVLSYNPAFKARTQRKFDARGRTTQIVQLPHPSYPYRIREEMDPVTRRYEGFRQPVDSAEVALMRVTEQQCGDTTVRENQLMEPVWLKLGRLVRVVSRTYHLGDTIRLDVVGYDEAGRPITLEGHYFRMKNEQQLENGTVSYAPSLQALLDTSARARQWRSQGLSDAALQMRAARWLRPTYLPKEHNTYDAAGRRLSSVYQEVSAPEQPRTSQDKNMTLVSMAIRSSSRTYTYGAKGQPVREEMRFSSPAVGQFPALERVVVTEKTYSPKGLLLTETTTTDEQKTSRYMYRYTTH